MEFMLQVLVSLCLINFTVESELICSQRPIVAQVGDDVILPCHLEPPVSVIDETVMWTRPDLNPPYVHYHQDGRLMIDRQNPDYFLRTSLFTDELTKGNVSMKIFRVNLSDAGTYSCSLPSMKKEASIQLIIKPEIICSSESVEAAVSEDVTLQCHFVTPLDATNMITEWRHESQNHTGLLIQDGHTSLFPEELTKGNLSLKISSVQLSDSGRYRCSVTSGNLQHSCYVNLTVGNINRTEVNNNFSESSDKTLIIGIAVGVGVLLTVVTVIVTVLLVIRSCQGGGSALNDVAFGLDNCTTVFECSMGVVGLAGDM